MDETLGEKIISHLKNIFPAKGLKELQQVSIGRNIIYVVKTNSADIVIKCAPLLDSDALCREYQVISKINSKGGPVPHTVPWLNGKNIQVRFNKIDYSVRGYEFVKGFTPVPSASSFSSLGVSIGQLHNAWEVLERPTWIPEVTVSDLIYDSIEVVSNQFNDKEKLLVANKFAHSVASILEAHRDRKFLGFSHGDAHHLNAIQTDSGEIKLIDLEDFGWQWRMYDLATAIWGTFGRGGSPFIWNGLIAGYTSVRPINKEEEMLIRFLIFARHLWWMDLHARNWNRWPALYPHKKFFGSGIDLLISIGRDVCGLKL